MTIAVAGSSADPANKFVAIAAAGAIGFFGPNEWVNLKAKRRQKEISRGLPNSLDLMVVCVESGLGLDQAILQVSKELEHAHPDISEEFALVNLELKAGKRRVEALRNLSERTASDDLKKLVAVLIQADRFGTGVAQSLRAHSDFMRVQAKQIAEEKAQQHSAVWKRIQAAVERLDAADASDYVKLSIAAKAYFMHGKSSRPTTPDELSKMAQSFGWKVSEQQLQEADEWLESLGLVETVAAS